jgi:hypothetical protein
MKINSASDTESYLRQLEQKQVELLERIETLTLRLNGFLNSPAGRSGLAASNGSRKSLSPVEARLETLESLTQRWIQQSAVTHARVEEILDSRIWRSLSLLGGLLLRFTGKARR